MFKVDICVAIKFFYGFFCILTWLFTNKVQDDLYGCRIQYIIKE